MRICVEGVVNDERGIHARPSAMIVKASRAYPGAVTVSRADEPEAEEYDCKDMMSLIGMEAAYRTRVRFCVETPVDLSPADLGKAEQEARAVGARLIGIISLTLEEIERLHLPLSLTAVVLLAAGQMAAVAAPWHLPGWSTRAVVKIAAPAETDLDTAGVKILGQGAGKPDGTDYRVVDEAGAAVPFMIQFHDAARYSILSFRATDTNRTYYVYSGNPGAARAAEQVAFDARLGAGPPQAPWVPRAGLVLTTLRRPEGANPMTSDEMAKLIAGSPTAYGARFQRRIADGYNPFGPSDMYMSVYRGWIRIPKAGRYEFCTASNEGSFSFLDGKELVHWPGRHTEERGRLGEFHAAIELAAGPHYIEYYHEEVYLQQMAFLGWRPPGAERFVGIPESLFTAPHGGEVLAYETPSGAAPRFEPVLMDSIWPETRSEGQYTRWAFRLAPALAAQANASWDFGDGQTSGDGMNARHVYLNAGHYPVRLTIGRTIVEWPLDVYELQHLTAQAGQGNMGEYLTAARGYDRSRLDADGLRSWAHLLADAQKPEEALKAANEFLSRFGSAPSGVVMEVRRLASDCQLALGVGNADDAVAGFEATLASDLPLADKFKASARLILALGVERNWADRATNVFARVEQLTRDARIDAETQKAWRGVVIAAGDVELGRGRINAAQDYYRRAEKLREEFVPPQVRAARIGAWPDGVRQYLKKRDYAGALTSVDRWEDAFPLDKVRGETFFWRGKALLLSGQAAEAERPLSRAVELGLGAPFETEARWLRAGALDKLGRTEEARKELRRLLSTGLRDTYTDQAAKAVGGR